MIIGFIAKHAAMIGLMFFFTFFSLMAVWVFRPGSKNFYKNDATIPLQEMNDE